MIVFVFVLSFIFFLHPFEGSGDFYHHINTGNFILQNHILPTKDVWTFTAHRVSWIAHSWGSGIIFALLLKNFGAISITIFAAFMAGITLSLLYLLLRSYKFTKLVSVLTIAMVTPLLATRWPQRPELFEYIFVLGILLIDANKEKFKKLIFLIPVIILIWANFYGSSVIFGLILIGYIVLKNFKDIKFYILFLISFVLAFVNPYTYKTVFYIFIYIPKITSYNGEWAGIARIISSMPISQLVTIQYYILTYFIFLGTLLLLFIFSLKTLKKNIWYLVLAPAIFAPIFVFRNLPLAAILVSPLLATFIKNQTERKRYVIIFLAGVTTIIMLVISIWVNPLNIITPQNKSEEQMIGFIKNNNLKGNVFNMQEIGGYLTYKLYPNVKVFFDTRDDLFVNSEALKDLENIFNNNLSVIPVISKYKADMIIGDYLSDNLNYHDLFYSLDWTLVYINDEYFVFVPTKTANEKHLTPLNFIDPYSKTAAKLGHEKEAAKYYKDNGDTYLLSMTYFALGDFDQVININKNIQIDDKTVVGPIQEHNRDLILADSYFGKKDCVNMKKYLDEAIKLSHPPLIFSPQDNQIILPDKELAEYYLTCAKDPEKANMYLNNYLNNNDNSPIEKLELQRMFETLKFK